MDLFKILDSTPEPPIVNLNTDVNTSGDYWLAVPMSEYQKELTDQVVSLHYSDILKYFETDDKDQLLLDSLEVLYLNSQLVATHPYLLISHYLPKNLTSKDIPYNLSETSGKFQVLKDIVALLEDKEINVAVVTRSGKSMDLVEALLLGSKTNIKRHYGNYIRDPAKNKQRVLTTHIIPSDKLYEHINEKFDLLFAFDITPETSFLQSLRKNDKTPIIRFVSANSIDHVALYFRKSHSERSHKYLVDVTAAIVVLRDRVGVLPPDLRPIYSKKLTYLKDWFQDYESKPWPLPDMSPIKKYDSSDVERSLLTEVKYEKKDSNIVPKSFYEQKRLNNDYTSNPLKDFTFGILSTNQNYTASLTHKLIQEFNVRRTDLEVLKKELEHFDVFEHNAKDFLLADETKIINEIDHYEQRQSIANSKSEKFLKATDDMKAEIEALNKEIEELSTGKILHISKIDEETKLLRHKKEALETEKSYMEKEICNASQSIEDSEKTIAEIKQQISVNESKLQDYFKDYSDFPIENNELDNLKSELTLVKLQIEENLTKLTNGRSRENNRRISPSVK